MSESSVNGEALTPTELVRFAKCHNDLVDRTRSLASSEKINMVALANETGLAYSWVRRFIDGSAVNVDITSVCTLYLALVGEDPARS